MDDTEVGGGGRHKRMATWTTQRWGRGGETQTYGDMDDTGVGKKQEQKTQTDGDMDDTEIGNNKNKKHKRMATITYVCE